MERTLLLVALCDSYLQALFIKLSDFFITSQTFLFVVQFLCTTAGEQEAPSEWILPALLTPKGVFNYSGLSIFLRLETDQNRTSL